MGFGIAFAPLVPSYVLWAAAGVALVLAVLLIAVRSRGGLVRALALAMIHVLIRDDLLDHDYIANHTLGFEALALFYGTEESKEGGRAFREKRAPNFRAKSSAARRAIASRRQPRGTPS